MADRSTGSPTPLRRRCSRRSVTRRPAFDLLLWPVARWACSRWPSYKAVSNQKALARVKSQISMRLLEIRLFSHDLVQVLRSTATILVKNLVYLGNHMVPMADHARAVRGDPRAARRELRLRPVAASARSSCCTCSSTPRPRVSARDVDARAARRASRSTRRRSRTADGQVFWRAARRAARRPRAARIDRRRRDATRRAGRSAATRARCRCAALRGLEAILYPGEPALPAAARCSRSSSACTRARSVRCPTASSASCSGRSCLSLVAGFALKGVFGVTL